SAHPTVDSVLFTWLVSSASPAKVLLLAAPIVAAAMWALLSPPVVLSREMTWDLLFNLAGAWHVHLGHVAHVDFHEPVGQLNFLLRRPASASSVSGRVRFWSAPSWWR